MVRVSAPSALVEREDEIARLRALLAATADGAGRTALIEGPAGIGKTRLLEATRELAGESGVRVAWARGSELEREYGFGVVRQLLEQFVIGPDGSVREDMFVGAASLAAPLFERDSSGTQAALEPDYSTLHGLYWLVAGLAGERPLVLGVDDVQWSDSPSLRFLSFAARRLEDLPVSIVATRRTAEAGADPELVSQLVAEPGVFAIRPRPLTEGGVETVARQELGVDPGSDFVGACLESTGGNPFFLKALLGDVAQAGSDVDAQTVRELTDAGSERISTVLLRRLRALPGGAKELAQAVSVLGDGAQVDAAARLAGLDMEVAEDALDGLVRAAVLTDGDGIAFAHPIVRSSVYSSLSPAARSDLHQRAARQLEQGGARIEEIAQQLLHANPGMEPGAVVTLREAASRSLALGAPESAAGFLSRAIREPLDAGAEAEVLFELGRAEMRAGMPQGEAHLRQVFEHSAASASQRGQAALDLGEFLMYTLRPEEGIPVLEGGLAATEDADPDLAKRLEATLIFNAFSHTEGRRQVLPRLRALRPPGKVRDTDPARLLFAALAFEGSLGDRRATEVIALAESCLAYRGPMHGATEGTAIALALVAMACAGRADVAEAHADQLIALARDAGSAGLFARFSANRAVARWLRGNLAGAEADGRAIMAIEGDPGLEVLRPVALAAIVHSLTERGELEAADQTALMAAGPSLGTTTERMLAQAIMDLRLARGEPQDAVEEAERFRRFEADWGVGPAIHLLEWRWRAAAAHAAAGDMGRAREVADEQLALATRFGSDRALGIALRTSALLSREVEPIDALRRAVDLLPRQHSALERARTLVELGATLRRQSHRTDAREPLQEAMELARDCGALVLAKRAHTELRAAGGHPRTPLRTGLDALTPSERRVAEMAAEGLANAEIAQGLFVTVKTIEMHLGNAYRKLEIGGRADLTRVLREPVADGRPAERLAELEQRQG